MKCFQKKHFVMLFFALLLFAGCARRSHMRLVPPDRASYAPESGKSLIIFMRPSTFGLAIQASVFDVFSNSDDKFIGISQSKKKIAYQAEPGEHLFMVIGESADFMKADLKEGKTYYALVTPRMGLWKARFSLKPIHKDKLDSEEFAKWNEGKYSVNPFSLKSTC